MSGRIVALQICPGHRLPMEPAQTAVFRSDYGIEGDGHARAGSRRQVLLIEEEILSVLDLEPGQVKENVTTKGIDLHSLETDSLLGLGPEVILWVTKPCSPCGRMDEIRPGLQERLRGQRGMLAWVQRGGRVRVGDEIRPLGRGEPRTGRSS